MPPLDWEETVTFDLKPKPPLFKAKRTLSAVHVSHLPSLRLRKQKRSDVHELRRYSVSDFTCHVTFCESCTHTHTKVQGAMRQSPRAICNFPQDNTAAAGVTKRQPGSREIQEELEQHTHARTHTTIWGRLACVRVWL